MVVYFLKTRSSTSSCSLSILLELKHYGLHPGFERKKSFTLIVPKMLALAILPIETVQETFSSLLSKPIIKNHDLSVLSLVDAFERSIYRIFKYTHPHF